MNLKTYNIFINEELEFELPSDDLKKIESKFKKSLLQYRNFISQNIITDHGKVLYKNFDNIDINMIIGELNKDFGNNVVIFFNVEQFLRKIYQLLDLKSKRTKDKIEKEFDEYFQSLSNRVDKYIRKGEKKEDSDEHFDRMEGESSIISRRQYEDEKYRIQIELAKLQEWVLSNKKRVVIVFERQRTWRKGSTIKRFTEILNPKVFKIVTMGIPTEEEKTNWFSRYEKELPNPGQIAFFDRSWYNRAVVEPAMGYCTESQYDDFMSKVNKWENNLIDDGIILIKLWFSITQEKQRQRFDFRQKSPIKYWKYSPNDEKVVDKWDIITKYKNQMFELTSTHKSPWVIINSDDKKIGRLNAMRYVLNIINYDDKDISSCKYYPEVVNVLN